MGFYRHRRVEPFFPRIRYRSREVEFTRENARRLRAMESPPDSQIGDLIESMLERALRSDGERFDVILLSPIGDPDTFVLERPIPHTAAGRGSAWTQGTRYTSEASLRGDPRTTQDLD